MGKLAIAAVLAGSAAAFAPAPHGARSSVATQMAYDSELGVQPPLGFYDPLGVLDGASQQKFDRFRGNEIKHGRISMLAIAGHVTTSAGIRFPGYISTSENVKFSDIPSGLNALAKIPGAGLLQILVFVGCLELFVMKDITGGEFPGDFRNGFIDFGWDTFDEETKLQKRAIELNNGRAAMMGILALMVHEKLGDAYIINTLVGAPVSL